MTTVQIAFARALLVVRRQGRRWSTEEHLAGKQPQSVAVDPLRPARVYCGTSSGLWYSADAGTTWQPVGAGITHSRITALAVSRHERASGLGVVYAGTEPSAIFRSEDGGGTWQPRPGLAALPSASTWTFPPRPWSHHVRAIALDARAAQQLYVCIEAGALLRSADGGQTWVDHPPDGPRDTHTLATHPRAPGRLYAAAGDGVIRPGAGYAESDDGGDTWRYSSAGLEHQYGWGLAVDPGDPSTVVISMARSPEQAHNPQAADSALYRKTADSDWQPIEQGLPTGRGMLVAALAANDAEPGVFYAACNQGLYRSSDTGLSWARIEIPWPQPYRFQRVAALAVAEPG